MEAWSAQEKDAKQARRQHVVAVGIGDASEAPCKRGGDGGSVDVENKNLGMPSKGGVWCREGCVAPRRAPSGT